MRFTTDPRQDNIQLDLKTLSDFEIRVLFYAVARGETTSAAHDNVKLLLLKFCCQIDAM